MEVFAVVRPRPDTHGNVARRDRGLRDVDIVYLDSPYAATLEKPPRSLALLAHLGASSIVERDGLVLSQVQKGLDLPAQQGALSLQRQRTYGQTLLGIYQATT